VPKYREVKIKNITIADMMRTIIVLKVDEKADKWNLMIATKDDNELEGVPVKKVWEWLAKNVKSNDVILWKGFELLEAEAEPISNRKKA
jgi:hypothetical protein